MRVTLLTIGSHGDVRPYVALGKGLQARGHQVRIGTHAEFEGDQPFGAERVYRAGAGPRPLPFKQFSRPALALAMQQAVGSERIGRRVAELFDRLIEHHLAGRH